MAKKPAVLIIRDGWAENPGGQSTATKDGNATLLADTPFHDHLFASYPMSRISGSGPDVGLPEGQMGNSEVGHLNLGAGRVVYQDLLRIDNAISDGSFFQNESLRSAFLNAKSRDDASPIACLMPFTKPPIITAGAANANADFAVP